MAEHDGPLVGPSSYDAEPPRWASLQINSKCRADLLRKQACDCTCYLQAPFNAEPCPQHLATDFLTPVHAFYKRNHGPVPTLRDQEEYRVEIAGLVPTPLLLSMADIRKLPKYEVAATLQCAGNRRTEMSVIRSVKGVGWGLGAVGNAVWGGARLADVLKLAGIEERSSGSEAGGRFVEFISVDQCKEEKGGAYTASVPLLQASSPEGDVLLAYEMNEEPLDRDHGYPLRVVVPGNIGARSVKWLHRILVTPQESQGFFTQNDYKMFPPSVDWDNVQWNARRPIMDYPVQSAICAPLEGEAIVAGAEAVVRGYALSGGGRGIERVDVSVDGGGHWEEAVRLPQVRGREYAADEGAEREKWAWVLWEHRTVLHPPCQIVVKAVDSAAGSQPGDSEVIWNLRGVLNNSWHRVNVKTLNAPHESPLGPAAVVPLANL